MYLIEICFLILWRSRLSFFFWRLQLVSPRLVSRLGGWTGVALVVVTAAAATGSRDSNLMIVVAGVLYVAVLNWHIFDSRKLATLCLAVLIVILNQSVRSSRWYLIHNAGHILAGFGVLQPNVDAYFSRLGLSTDLVEGYRPKLQNWCQADMNAIDTTQHKMRVHGLLKKVSLIWPSWLLTHPAYVIQQTWHDRACILGQSFTKSAPWGDYRNATNASLFVKPGMQTPLIQQATLALP